MSDPIHDESLAAALRAAKFGTLVRALISQDAAASQTAAPEFYAGLMSDLSSVADDDIARMAVPHVREEIAPSAARAALDFFSTPSGTDIANKLSNPGVPGFTRSEESALSEFSATEDGAKFLTALGNPLLLAAMVQSLSDYAP